MPRFYFHTDDGPKTFRDTEGVHLDDLSAARVEAVRVLGELLRETAVEFWDSGHMTVTVESGGQSFRLRATAE